MPAHNFIDLTGMVFHRWHVESRADNYKTGSSQWNCVCSCDKRTRRVVAGASLIKMLSKSCGCYRSENTTKMKTTHGARMGRKQSTNYTIWCNAKARCYNPSGTQYDGYGGREKPVGMSNEFIDNFEAFDGYISSLENYGKEGYTLDRFPDNDGDYERGNLRWATKSMQAFNRGLFKVNKTGYPGVSQVRSGKYIAYFSWQKSRKHLGTHLTALKAHQARQKYIRENHPELYSPNL